MYKQKADKIYLINSLALDGIVIEDIIEWREVALR